MSRPELPKQFLALTDERTMLQLTVQRVSTWPGFAAPLIVASSEHVQLVDAQLAEIGFGESKTVLEPVARNTAPAIALAAIEAENDTCMLVMPSDHVIGDVESFHKAIRSALPLAEEGWLITFGIAPEGPETGYGYIKIGSTLADGVCEADQFIEKPKLERARAMLAEGGYAWNGGIFLFRADAYLAALESNAPAISRAMREAMAGARREHWHIYPAAAAFRRSPADSIDCAVMEVASQVAVAPVNMKWSDVGSWDALYEVTPQDAAGNVLVGEVTALESRNCLVRAKGMRIAMMGVSDLTIVASGSDILILPRGRGQEIKRLVRRGSS
ncbi:mannose-1-phosphate guanylyltransferase [Stakelama saccharophila]|uniref:Sugar phosphate nucleotidyltransferase n=1 Tax=Stakelama saccharophila TaxID=3075605 RepID=A0ABZ0BD36_9SPHN|nr:sugar phosphate nucleotidyltransferase [Stakelama sp. W311]WNO55219.1 sugar phosphate nucleotidyltransferase [Stakelama sp. W311]